MMSMERHRVAGPHKTSIVLISPGLPPLSDPGRHRHPQHRWVPGVGLGHVYSACSTTPGGCGRGLPGGIGSGRWTSGRWAELTAGKLLLLLPACGLRLRLMYCRYGPSFDGRWLWGRPDCPLHCALGVTPTPTLTHNPAHAALLPSLSPAVHPPPFPPRLPHPCPVRRAVRPPGCPRRRGPWNSDPERQKGDAGGGAGRRGLWVGGLGVVCISSVLARAAWAMAPGGKGPETMNYIT